MLSWRLGNVRDITTSLALPDAYLSMAFAAPAFRLDDLPSEARDVVFGALLRRDAARACCVSKGWRDAFGSPHNWAALDFTDEAAFGAGERAENKAERRPLLAATVLGACEAARGALTHVTLPQTREMVALLPELAATLPLLRRVTLSAGCDATVSCGYWGWDTTEMNALHSLLHRDGEPLEEVSLGAVVGVLNGEDAGQECADLRDLLLNDASPLQVTDLCVTHNEVAARMAHCAAVMRVHAHTLRNVTFRVHNGHGLRSVPVTLFLEALCGCRTLEVLHFGISGSRLLRSAAAQGAHPFAAVADALRAAGTLRKLELIGYTHELRAGVDGATPASLLLPQLTHLEIAGTYPASESDFDARCVSSLARALQHNTTLRTLQMRLVNDVRLPGDAPDEDAQDALQRHLDGRPLLPLRVALPTTQLRRLEVETGPNRGLCSLAALARALPRSLQELDIVDMSDDAVWTMELPPLVTAVYSLPLISKLDLYRGDNDKPIFAESGMHLPNAFARMLLHPTATPPLLRTLSLGSCDRALPDACLTIADALWSNATLTELKLYNVTWSTIRAFGAVLQRNTTLRSLTLTLTIEQQMDPEPLLPLALISLRTGLQRNATLRGLMLDLCWWPPVDDDEEEPPELWTLEPLAAALKALEAAGAEHPTCTLELDTRYYEF